MVWVLAKGMTSAAPTPRAGQTARKDIGIFITLVAHGARTGAFLAPDMGELPFLPYAGFVCTQISRRLPTACSGRISVTWRRIFLKSA